MILWRHWLIGQLDASIVAALLLAIALLLRHRLPPSLRSAMLLIAMARLVVPPWLRAPWSEALVDVPPIDEGRTLMAIALDADAAMSIAALTTAVTIVLLARLVRTFATSERRWVAATIPAPDAFAIAGVDLRVSPTGEGPLAAGLKRKLVVLPESALALAPDALHAVIAHEVAHHERRDLWWIAIAEVLKSIAWFNPLAHLIARALIASREDGCDDSAVRRTSNDPFKYAQALLQSARLVADRHPLGVAGAHPMGRRLQRLLDPGAARERRLGLAGAVLIFGMAAVAIPGAHMPSPADTNRNQRVVIVIER